MNILFLTLLDFNTIYEPGIYTDLLREFVKHGDEVYVVSPVEKRKGVETPVIKVRICDVGMISDIVF